MHNKPQPPPHKPYKLSHRGTIHAFERVCRITGDLIYSATNQDGAQSNIILTNPNAHDHQREAFNRGIVPFS